MSVPTDAESALLVIDMQNAFCHPTGSIASTMAPLADVEQTAVNVGRAVEGYRRAGVPIVFVKHCYQPGYADLGSNMRSRLTIMNEGGLLRDSWDAAFVDELPVGPGDLVVEKCRYDAFFETPLDLLLRKQGVRKVILAGVVTNVCVETTARSAFMRDYSVTILEDCCAARSRRLHALSIEALSAYQLAHVTSLSEIFPD